MKVNRLRWFGHMQRRAINEHVRKIESWSSGDLKRGRGRPKMSWMTSGKDMHDLDMQIKMVGNRNE